MPERTDSGDLVQPVALFAPENPATPLQGGDIPGKPIRAADGTLVTRVGIYKVEGGVAVPADKLGSDVGTDLTAEPPLQMTNDGDGTGTISIDTDVPGGVPTLDQNTVLRLSQMPISGLNYHGAWNASTNTPALADGSGTAGDFYRVSVAGTQDLGSGPITFEVGDHVLYEGTTWQQLDPAQVIDWGDIQGTLSSQSDLQAALDAKADTADVPAGANPSAQVGLAATDGSAATFLRSDAAPALDQSIAPTWTGAHEFQDAASFTAAATETDPSVEVASANPQVELRRTDSDADEKRWNLVADPDQLVLRALTDAGDVADNAWLVTRSGGTVTAHSLQTGGSEALGIGANGEVTIIQPLHMSGSRIAELGDPEQPTDAVNQQTLQAAIAALAAVATSGDYGDLSGRPLVRDSGDVQLQLIGEVLRWPNTTNPGKIRLYEPAPGSNATFHGFGVGSGTLEYHVDSQTAVHKFIAATGSDDPVEILRLGVSDEIVASYPLHMGEKKIHNLADGDAPRDAVNKQQLDAADLTNGGTVDGNLNASGVVVSQNDVNAQRDVTAARYVNAAFAFSTPTDGTNTPDPATNGVNIFGQDQGGQHLVAQWQDGTISVIARHGFSFSQAAHVADADPTSLATLASSINAIRDVLVDAGLMADG